MPAPALARVRPPRRPHPRPECRPAPRPAAPACGYGACSVSGCPCPAFKETYGSQLCNNCGHQYTDHW
jgi:hypothetical protein